MDFVSVVCPEKYIIENHLMAFGRYVQSKEGSISFVINTEGKDVSRSGQSGFSDEGFIGAVERERIEGIIIPKKLLDTALSRLPIGLSAMGYGMVEERVKMLMPFICRSNSATERRLHELLDEFKIQESYGYSAWDEAKHSLAELDSFVAIAMADAYGKILKKDNTTLRDIIETYGHGLPVFDSDTGERVDIARTIILDQTGGLDFATASKQNKNITGGGVKFSESDAVEFLKSPDFVGMGLEVESVSLK